MAKYYNAVSYLYIHDDTKMFGDDFV